MPMFFNPVTPENKQPLHLAYPSNSLMAWRRAAKQVSRINDKKKEDQAPESPFSGSAIRFGAANIEPDPNEEQRHLDRERERQRYPSSQPDKQTTIGKQGQVRSMDDGIERPMTDNKSTNDQ